MINIIPTLTVMDSLDEYEVMINNFIASNSTLFRCNATRFDNKVYEESIKNLQKIYYKKTGRNFKLLLDIPYPKDKHRIEFIRKVNQYSIRKGDKIIIVNSKEKMQAGNVYIDLSNDEFVIGQEIIIGDGDAILVITEKKEGYIECISKCEGEIGYKKACYLGNNYCHMVRNNKLDNYIKPESVRLNVSVH